MSIRTRIICVTLMAAPVALLQVASERRRAAALEGAQDAALRRAERSAVRLAVGFAVAAKYLRHLPLRAIHSPGLQQNWRAAGVSSAASGCGSSSRGLVVE